MQSRTKYRQSVETLRSMVERAYGAGQCADGDDFMDELDHGWFNAVYLVRLRDRRKVVLKIAPAVGSAVMTYERDLMRNELAALELLRSRSPIPVPAIEFADLSREICDADWFFMEFIDGENFGQRIESGGLAVAAAAPLYEQLGRLNRQLNGIIGPGFGSIADPKWASWREAFTNLVDGALADGARAGVELGCDHSRVTQAVAKHAEVLDDVTEAHFVAWDLWPSNAITSADRLVAIIDPERAMYADPLMEAGLLGRDLPIFGDPVAFGRGYGRWSLTAPEEMRRRLYTLYLILIMIIEPSYRGTQDPNQVVWCRERLADLLQRLESSSRVHRERSAYS
jgi:aminoglycoside phosphotransferase (APT) family kinase protein